MFETKVVEAISQKKEDIHCTAART